MLLNNDLSDDDINKIYNLVKKSEGIEKARTLAMRFTDRSFKRIEYLPINKNKELFMEIFKKLLIRNY